MTLLEEAGGSAAASAAEVGRASDSVFIMVMNGQQIMDLLQGEEGLLAGMAPGGTLIITATIEPREMRAVAALLAGSGLHLIDSPVSGGRSGANAGTLTLMAAGASDVFVAQQDVLGPWARSSSTSARSRAWGRRSRRHCSPSSA